MAAINPGGKPGLAEPCGCKDGCGKRLPMRQRANLLLAAKGITPGQNLIDQANKLIALKGELGAPPFDVIAKLVAISEAESTGYTEACHLNSNGTFDRGWGQINSVHGYGASSYNPASCAGQIWAVFHSQGYGAWTTYGGARYLAALPAATVAARGGAVNTLGLKVTTPGPCVHSTKLPTINAKVFHLGGETICWDVVVGGLKMGLGALGTGVSLLALTYFLARSVPGGAQANSAAGKVLGAVPGPSRAYRTVAGTGARRSERREVLAERARRAERHQSAMADAETRRTVASQREIRRSLATKSRTVYVTEDDPAYRRRRAEQAERMTAHRQAERARAEQIHGDPDAPPY